MATAIIIDPTFHSLPFISDEEQVRMFAEVAVKMENIVMIVDTHLHQVITPLHSVTIF